MKKTTARIWLHLINMIMKNHYQASTSTLNHHSDTLTLIRCFTTNALNVLKSFDTH